MKETVYENTEHNRFFVCEFESETLAPIVARSALDAAKEVNGELQDKLADIADLIHEVSPKSAASCIAGILTDLGYGFLRSEEKR